MQGHPEPVEPSSPAWRAHLPAGMSVRDVDLARHRNLYSCWARSWREEPSRRVVGEGQGTWASGAEMDDRSAQVMRNLQDSGLRQGDRLVVVARLSLRLVVLYAAALRMGVVLVPVNPALTRREVSHVLSDAAPSAVAVDDETQSAVDDATFAGMALVGWDGARLRAAADDGAKADGAEADEPDRDDPALILYTSGTTGSPKGAVLTHGNLLASAEALRIAWRWTPEDRLVLALPLFHLHGLGVGLFGSLCAGASVVLRPSFDAGDVLRVARDESATLFFGVPTMFARLAGRTDVAGLSKLRLLVSGSAPLSAELYEAFAQIAGQDVLERYGMTETVMNVSNPYDAERRPGTVGFALPGVELRLADPTGEILLRGPNVFGGYWNRPDASAQCFDGEGWFATGDVGAFDEDGYLRIVGRSKELIISGGFNVYPREVEDALRAHPGVSDVAVVGRPDDVWGERVVAFVEAEDARAAPSESELMDLASSALAPYKRPKEIHVVASLPRNALGKVTKSSLGG